MATLNVVLARADGPVPNSKVVGAQSITTTGSSQQSSVVSGANHNASQFWILTATGGNVWVKFGTNPTAAAGSDWLILDGQTREFKSAAGEKVAVINA
jgi:hypothetical protein